MAEPFQYGNYFVSTGYPKSGNTWAETMLFELPNIEGYSVEGHRMPVVCERFLENRKIIQALKQSGVSFQSFLMKLLNPSEPPLGLSLKSQKDIELGLKEYSIRAKTIYNIYFRQQNSEVADELCSRLFSRNIVSQNITSYFGCPSKHLGYFQLRRLLPNFKIIWIIRDPRDVLVSYFYHDIGGHLTEHNLKHFVHLNGEVLAQRYDWRERYFRWRRNQMLAFFAPLLFGYSRHAYFLKYEQLLDSAVDGLTNLLRRMGYLVCTDAIQKVEKKYNFKNVVKEKNERRNSFIRKGMHGDWRRYFDKSLVNCLGFSFRLLVKRLGYELCDSWVEELPQDAGESFDFSRFRIKRTICYNHIEHWFRKRDLQRRYPYPYDFTNLDNFYSYLSTIDDQGIEDSFHFFQKLQELWSAQVDETAFH